MVRIFFTSSNYLLPYCQGLVAGQGLGSNFMKGRESPLRNLKKSTLLGILKEQLPHLQASLLQTEFKSLLKDK